MAGKPASSWRERKWLGAVLAGIVLVALIALGAWLADGSPDDQPPVDFSPVSGPDTADSTPFVTVPPQAPSTPPQVRPDATLVGTPSASPVAVVTPGISASACADGCMVRIPSDHAAQQILEATGERPSYESAEWRWSVVSRETVDLLGAAGVPLYLVHDSPETLYLYATRKPPEGAPNAAIESIGQIIDQVDGHSIVLASSVPPVVTEVVDAGIWIEKIRPAAPEVVGAPAGSGPSLADVELGTLMPEVDPDAIWSTIVELQGMSSTDGTGIGTRQYSQPGNVMTAEYLYTRLETLGLTVWYEDFLTWEGYLVTNVLGEIPGRDDSMVYGVMAHLDSTAESFAEAPGADDNATGVAGTLEIARILAGYELKHPVHVIFVNAEETAIVGAMAYADGIVQNGTPIEGIFNLDTIGNPAYGPRLILNSGPQSAWMTDLLIRVNNGYGLGQDIRAYQSDAIISDDTMLRRQGIESVLIARLLADDYGVHHSAEDTIEVLSLDHTVTATWLVLLALGALVQ